MRALEPVPLVNQKHLNRRRFFPLFTGTKRTGSQYLVHFQIISQHIQSNSQQTQPSSLHIRSRSTRIVHLTPPRRFTKFKTNMTNLRMPKNKKRVRPHAIQDKRSKPETDRETDQVSYALPRTTGERCLRFGFLRCDLPLSSSIQTRHCMKRQRNAVAENRSAEQERFPAAEGETWIHT